MPSIVNKLSIILPELALPEIVLPAALPADVAALTGLLHAQHQAYLDALQSKRCQAVQAATRAAHDYVIGMIEQAKLDRHGLYGASSEQMAAQGRLFDEAEALAQGMSAVHDVVPLPPAGAGDKKLASKPGRGKRAPLSATLPRVDILHDVPVTERTFPCGTPMIEIGEDVSEQLDIVPMQVRVLRHVRKRYGCPGSAQAPVTAPLPAQPLPKSNASANFLAMLLVAKFLDGLPLARFEHVLARHGVQVPRQTLARW